MTLILRHNIKQIAREQKFKIDSQWNSTGGKKSFMEKVLQSFWPSTNPLSPAESPTFLSNMSLFSVRAYYFSDFTSENLVHTQLFVTSWVTSAFTRNCPNTMCVFSTRNSTDKNVLKLEWLIYRDTRYVCTIFIKIAKVHDES